MTSMHLAMQVNLIVLQKDKLCMCGPGSHCVDFSMIIIIIDHILNLGENYQLGLLGSMSFVPDNLHSIECYVFEISSVCTNYALANRERVNKSPDVFYAFTQNM